MNKTIKYCKRCKSNITIPSFTEEQKLEIWSMKYSGMSLFGIKLIQDNSELNLEHSKFLFDHVNKKYGECTRCNNKELKIEHVECAQCKAFNLNWEINKSFSFDFCIALEYKLNAAFENSKYRELQRFGCLGVDILAEKTTFTSVKNVEKRKIIETNAWLGYLGENRYRMKIKLGKKSMQNYLEKMSIIEFIPNKEIDSWIDLDMENKTIKIELE